MSLEREHRLREAIRQVIYHRGEPMLIREIRTIIDPFGLMENDVSSMVYHQVDAKELVWLPDLRVGLVGWPNA